MSLLADIKGVNRRSHMHVHTHRHTLKTRIYINTSTLFHQFITKIFKITKSNHILVLETKEDKKKCWFAVRVCVTCAGVCVCAGVEDVSVGVCAIVCEGQRVMLRKATGWPVVWEGDGDERQDAYS